MEKVKVIWVPANEQAAALCKEGKLLPPVFKTLGSAGADLKAFLPDDTVVTYYDEENEKSKYYVKAKYGCEYPLPPKERALIPTGFKVVIPEGYEMQLRPRSGNAIKLGLSFPNCVGTIDSDYRDEVMIEVTNISNQYLYIENGERIAQVIMAKLPDIEHVIGTEADLTPTNRHGGIGSTGNQ